MYIHRDLNGFLEAKTRAAGGPDHDWMLRLAI